MTPRKSRGRLRQLVARAREAALTVMPGERQSGDWGMGLSLHEEEVIDDAVFEFAFHTAYPGIYRRCLGLGANAALLAFVDALSAGYDTRREATPAVKVKWFIERYGAAREPAQ